MSRLDQLQQLLKDDPNDAFLTYALALELEQANRLDEAIVLLEQLLLKNNDYLATYYRLGQWYELKGAKEKAKLTYENGVVIAKQQHNTRTLKELNEALSLIENFDHAE